MESEKIRTCLVRELDGERMGVLKSVLAERGWEFGEAPHALYKAWKGRTQIVAYVSGKLVVQGKEAQDFISFILEPEVLGELAFGQMDDAPPSPPEPFSPHAGMDESGKGDFFGPLVISAVYVGKGEDRLLAEAGVRDSKTIKSDGLIAKVADDARRIVHGNFAVVSIGPEAYNKLYGNFGSLNKLLAWGHARALENLLERAPDCQMALADKFGDERLIRNALLTRGRSIRLEQRTKAESDMAVAAASVIARSEFVRRLKQLGESLGSKLPKGAGSEVDKVAAELAAKGGAELLARAGKMHFRTSYKALGLEPPPKTEWNPRK